MVQQTLSGSSWTAPAETSNAFGLLYCSHSSCHASFNFGLYPDHTENHWQSAQSLVSYLIFLDSHINTGTPEKTWLWHQ
eukprot:871849-Amphidinium_carterae.1